MANIGYLIIIGLFLLYYIAIAYFEKEFITEPRKVIEKFLAVVLAFAGFSLMYFSLTGQPFLTDSINDYFIYIFVIGFISLLWAIPTLLLEFSAIRRFNRKFKRDNKKVKRRR